MLTQSALVDILIPTYQRALALTITLTSLCAQTWRNFRVVISDQTDDSDIATFREMQTVLRLLRSHGHTVELHKHLPRRGLAEHRQFLLDQTTAPYALFLDDDLILEPEVVASLVHAIQFKWNTVVLSAVQSLA